MLQLPYAKSNLALVESDQTAYYQRESDGFFWISDACSEYNVSPTRYFRALAAKLIVAQLCPNDSPSERVT